MDQREEKWTVVIAGIGDAQELGAIRGGGFDTASGDGSLCKGRGSSPKLDCKIRSLRQLGSQ